MTNHLLAAVAVLCAALPSQTIWAPNGYATVPGNSNNSYPWHRATAPIRYQQIYSALNFTQQGVTYPVLLSRLRFRVYTSATSWVGGTWPSTILNLSTAATTYLAASATFASNQGTDLTNVYTGPITVMPGTGNGPGVPGPIYVDITFSTPFRYDPAAGDLCLEVVQDGVGWTGTSTFCDAVSGTTAPGGPAQATRVYNTTSHLATTGTVGANFTLVTEFTGLPPGSAWSSAYGSGCHSLSLAASTRPIIGTAVNLVTSNIPAGTVLGATILSNTRHDAGIDLAAIGMPGCRRYVDIEAVLVFVVSGASASVPQLIPNSPSFVGVRAHCQSATFSNGLTPLGVIASNGLTLVLDLL